MISTQFNYLIIIGDDENGKNRGVPRNSNENR